MRITARKHRWRLAVGMAMLAAAVMLFIHPPEVAARMKNMTTRAGLCGGTATDLDTLATATLQDGDFNLAFNAGKLSIHFFVADATDAEDCQQFVRPDDYDGDGVWVEGQSPYDVSLGAMPSGLEMQGVIGGQVANNATDAVYDLDFGPIATMDSTNTIVIKSSATITKRADASFVAGTGNGGMLNGTFSANTAYAAVAMSNGGDIGYGFLADSDLGSIATYVTAAGFDYYKVIWFGHSIGSAQWATFKMSGSYVIESIASENVLSNAVTTSYATVDHSAMIIDEYCELIWYGVRDATVSDDVFASEDGTNMSVNLGRTLSTTDDTNQSSWGSKTAEHPPYLPYNSGRYFQANGGTLDLLLHGYKIKR